MSVLHDAVRNDADPKALSKLLKKKAVSINHQDSDNLQTPLHVACIEGRLDLVKVLLKAGAQPNIRDSSGWTPLHCAAKQGHLRICEALLQNKHIDAGVLTIEKTSPLYYMVRKGPANEKVIVLPSSYR
tara:strand:+ start:2100 stop:2486 length:387 start_codon:yes stop_codon:yes gene_type:complete